jgi:hypothetical protein
MSRERETYFSGENEKLYYLLTLVWKIRKKKKTSRQYSWQRNWFIGGRHGWINESKGGCRHPQ